MGDVITIGVDLAKSVFQVHGVDAEGTVIVRRQLRRCQVLPFFEKLPPCLVGMEACATAHHWGREIQRLGHCVRLMPPRYVKAYVKTQKNDAADAEAICEAVTRPTMRFVELKTCEQQSILMLHRTRQLFVRQRITLINAIRAHLAEFGIVAPIGRNGVEKLLQTIGGVQDGRIPDVARTCLEALAMFSGVKGIFEQAPERNRQRPAGAIVVWIAWTQRINDKNGVVVFEGSIDPEAANAAIAGRHQYKSWEWSAVFGLQDRVCVLLSDLLWFGREDQVGLTIWPREGVISIRGRDGGKAHGG